METTGKQEAEETKKSSVLLIEGEKKDDTGGEKIEPDERFFQDEPDEKDDVDEKPKQALDKNFKKQIKKE